MDICAMTRRHLFARSSAGIGVAALATLLDAPLVCDGAGNNTAGAKHGGTSTLSGKRRGQRMIFLHQSGGPSQIDLFDYKPQLQHLRGDALPDSVRQGQRLTGMTAGQDVLRIMPSTFDFHQHGQAGIWLSDQLPYTRRIIDDVTLIKTMNTDAINHDPALSLIQTGSVQHGRPSMGAWLSYGLGSVARNLPAFVVLISQAHSLNNAQPLSSRCWGSGFMPSVYQGVRFRGASEPVSYLSNPPGLLTNTRRHMLNSISKLDQLHAAEYHDPEIKSRIKQYEMAFRMQTAVPELLDMSKESQRTFDLYGPESRTPGSYAANCLLARRLAERDVRFIQLYHRGWDQHSSLQRDLTLQCKGTDQPTAALITDLKRRGLLDETLVIWGGEFGRTVYCQGNMTDTDYGRDHH